MKAIQLIVQLAFIYLLPLAIHSRQRQTPPSCRMLCAFIFSVPNWYKIQRPNGQPGFVPKAWTEIASEDENVSPPTATSAAFKVHFLGRHGRLCNHRHGRAGDSH
jgi:hypothetical protein